MRFSLGKFKRAIVFVLAAMIILSTIPMMMAFSTTEKVVVDMKGNLTDGATDTDGKIIKKFSTIRDAIDYIDSTGEAEGTIYINGTYATTDHESISGSKSQSDKSYKYAPITITGYSGTADKLDLTDSYYHIVHGGELTVENITFGTPASDTSSLSTTYTQKAFWAANKFTIGENVVMTGSGLRLGGGYGWSGYDNYVEVHSGTYNYVYPASNPNQNTTRLNYSVRYDFYGGTVKNFYGGYISNSSGTPCILADIIRVCSSNVC